MNKKDLMGNHDSAVNVSLLSGSMKNKRILIVDDSSPQLDIKLLRAFFDIVIAIGATSARQLQDPDIVIYSRKNPHVNGVLDLTHYDFGADTILCVTYSELDQLKKIRRRHKSSVLSWEPVKDQVADNFIRIAGIDYGLNEVFPGDHLAAACGAKDIYSTKTCGDSLHSEIDKLINERSGYARKNLLRPNRPKFIDEVKLVG